MNVDGLCFAAPFWVPGRLMFVGAHFVVAVSQALARIAKHFMAPLSLVHHWSLSRPCQLQRPDLCLCIEPSSNLLLCLFDIHCLQPIFLKHPGKSEKLGHWVGVAHDTI